MCITDYDAPTMHCASIRKARKTHKCGECSRDIAAGEQYQYVAGVWDGYFLIQKTCIHCLEGQKLLRRECNGFLYGGIYEDLYEHAHAGAVLPWAMQACRIIVGMNRKWRRFDGNGLMKVRTTHINPAKPTGR